MPYPNEHAARLRDPARYERFRRENYKFARGVHAIWGILRGGKVELQAIRFDAGKFTADEARKWLKAHNFKPILFEPAAEEKEGKAMKQNSRAATVPSGFYIRGEPGGVRIEAGAASAEGKSLRRFSMTAYTDGAMTLSGWPHPVVVDLAGLAVGKKSRPILMDHDTGRIVGHTDAVSTEGGALKTAAVLSEHRIQTTQASDSKTRFSGGTRPTAAVAALDLHGPPPRHVRGHERAEEPTVLRDSQVQKLVGDDEVLESLVLVREVGGQGDRAAR